MFSPGAAPESLQKKDASMKWPSWRWRNLTEDSEFMNAPGEVKQRLAHFQAIMASFHFGRNGTCKVAGSKQKGLNKKVVVIL